MVFAPDRPKTWIAKEISDFNIQILLLLKLGFTAHNTEGADYRVWIENMVGKQVKFPLRKDTLGNLFGLGLLEPIDATFRSTCSYRMSKKGHEVLDLINEDRKRQAKHNLHKKGLEA